MKVLKYLGYGILGIILVLIIVLLLVRFVFRDEVIDFAKGLLHEKYTETLKSAKLYQSDNTLYSFELLSSINQSQELRNYFHLDSLIKGCNDTWMKTLNIARIVASIKHDNPVPNPNIYNAIDLWEWAKENPNGFNCRAHSIMLYEMLLSVGISNRVITCSPQDTIDSDCHVVNSVWLPEENKWVMVDSDNNIYTTDENGVKLSLEEMRIKIRNDEPIIFRTFDEHNVDEQNYRWYWAKNLYYFDAVEIQTYNIESSSRDSYRKVCLVPDINYMPKGIKNKHDLLTTDSKRFWEAPDTIKILG